MGKNLSWGKFYESDKEIFSGKQGTSVPTSGIGFLVNAICRTFEIFFWSTDKKYPIIWSKAGYRYPVGSTAGYRYPVGSTAG